MPSLIQKLLLAALGIVLPLACLEIALRIIPFSLPSPWSDRPQHFFSHENAHDVLDIHVPPEKPEGIFRIAVVGDSIAFGYHLQADDTFAARLERMLNLNTVPRRAEVVNFGIPGYSAKDEVQSMKRALRYHPDLVILQITLNDPEKQVLRGGGGNQKFGPFDPKFPFPFSHSHIVRFVAERFHNVRTRREYEEYFHDLFSSPETWKLYTSSTDTIISMAKEAQVPLVPILFPLLGHELDKSYPFSEEHAQLKRYFLERQIKLLDLFSVFKGIPAARLQVIPGGDFHPNEIGHRLAAETLLKNLIRQKLIPEELIPRTHYKERTHPLEVKETTYHKTKSKTAMPNTIR